MTERAAYHVTASEWNEGLVCVSLNPLTHLVVEVKVSETQNSQQNNHGKKGGGEEKDGSWRGVDGAHSAPGFIFNCSLRFFMVMSPPPPFQNNRLPAFASLAAFHFGGLFLKRLLL